jgi:hypothetical protein
MCGSAPTPKSFFFTFRVRQRSSQLPISIKSRIVTEPHEIEELEELVGNLRQSFASLAEEKELQEFLQITRRPRWTTVAEAPLVEGLSM